MYIKVWSKSGRAHLWAYENFKLATNAISIDYNSSGNLIHYIIYEVKQPVSQELFDEHNLEFEVLSDYVPKVKSTPGMVEKDPVINKPSDTKEEKSSVIQWWQKD